MNTYKIVSELINIETRGKHMAVDTVIANSFNQALESFFNRYTYIDDSGRRTTNSGGLWIHDIESITKTGVASHPDQ